VLARRSALVSILLPYANGGRGPRQVRPVRRHNGLTVLVVLLASALAIQPRSANAIEPVRPSIVAYVIENTPLKAERPSLAESVVSSEFVKRGYQVYLTLQIPNLAQLIPRDVRGVWNTDRRLSFRQQFRADVLWMATIAYNLDKTPVAPLITGQVTVVARALDAATGESLWFGRVADYKMQGTSLQEAARRALGEILPSMVAAFDSDPKVRQWTPAERPRPASPRGSPLPTTPRTAPGAAMAPGSPYSPSPAPTYTGVVINAQHLNVHPSFRCGIYTPDGRPIYSPNAYRMVWVESPSSALRQAGPSPLYLKAVKTDGDRVFLGENDTRALLREKGLLERRRVVIVVQPPKM